MDHPVVHFSTVLLAFFAIMNPIANAPLFLGLTEGVDAKARRGIALRAVVFAFAIVAVFSVAGRSIFDAFGVTLPAFRIAGGILVGLLGYHMLQGEHSSMHHPSDEDLNESYDSPTNIAISPLALPILAGPGTIATAMNFTAESTLVEVCRVLGAFAVMCAVTWLAFVGSQSISNFLGQNAIKVVTRLMGLTLTVIGVQMLIVGVRGAMAVAY